MKNLLFTALVAIGVVGCFSTGGERPADQNGIAVRVAAGHRLHDAVVSGATRRGWVAADRSAGVVRCTIFQRSNRVVVDVVLEGEQSYSIRCVESNIPVRKYEQWLGNLKRAIAAYSRGNP